MSTASVANSLWKAEGILMKGVLHVRQSAAVLVLAATLVAGGLLGLVLRARAGRPIFGDSHNVPVFVSHTPGAGDALSSNPMGFAPILKPALPAVVNIASSRVVKMPLEPFFSAPFFRQFFVSPSP